MRKIIQNLLLNTLGWCCVLLGLIGIFLPLLPTTPFMILALLIFSKSSDRFHRMLLHNRWFGPTLQRWEAERAMSRKTKHRATLFIIVSIGVSITLLHPQTQIQLGLGVLALLLLAILWRIPETD